MSVATVSITDRHSLHYNTRGTKIVYNERQDQKGYLRNKSKSFLPDNDWFPFENCQETFLSQGDAEPSLHISFHNAFSVPQHSPARSSKKDL